MFSAPSRAHPTVISCSDVTFHNKEGVVFAFDEDLFAWAQCECNHDHFGYPLQNCFACPSSGTSECGGRKAAVLATSFAYLTLDVGNGISARSLHTEDCQVTTAQVASGQSNCKGINITAEHLNGPVNFERLMETQCEIGSDGRLCARCVCNSTGAGDCYFQSGPKCSKCRRVFQLSTALPLAIGLIILVFIALVVVMTVVLRRKRSQSLVAWNELPILKRLFYRLYYMTTLGNVSIVITYVQILLSFTQWDTYAKFNVLGIVNIKTERYASL